MEGKVIAVVVVAGVLGVVATLLGFVGEATRIKDDQVLYSSEDGICYYPQTPAMALGIVAAILLLIQQIVISVGAGCFCCSRRHPCPSQCPGICSIICFVFSWIFCVGAFKFLIFAAMLNNMYYLVQYSSDSNPCPVGKPGYFAGAGVACLFSVALSFISYSVLICSRNKGGPQLSNDQGVAMGQPQLPKHQV